MRFFSSFVTARPLEVGGRSFIFEPVTPLGGGWLGVLAEADDASASILATSGDASEISEDHYNRLKKKLSPTSPVSGRLPTPRRELQHLVPPAGVAALPPSSTGAETPVSPTGPVEEVLPGPSVELQMTDKEPPPEPLLDIEPKKKSRRKKE